MPIHEFQCPTCGERFEEIVRLGATEAPPCPKCHGRDARRLLSVCAVSVSGGKSGATASGPPPASGGCGSGGFS